MTVAGCRGQASVALRGSGHSPRGFLDAVHFAPRRSDAPSSALQRHFDHRSFRTRRGFKVRRGDHSSFSGRDAHLQACSQAYEYFDQSAEPSEGGVDLHQLQNSPLIDRRFNRHRQPEPAQVTGCTQGMGPRFRLNRGLLVWRDPHLLVRGEEIQAELAKGWSAAAIWKVLTKNKEISCSYKTFVAHVRRLQRQTPNPSPARQKNEKSSFGIQHQIKRT